MKKLLALLLVALFAFSLAACSNDPQEDGTTVKPGVEDAVADEMIYENLKYAVNAEGYYSITGYIPDGIEDVELEIPAIIDGREVTAIADKAFRASKYITSVTFLADEETEEIYINAIGEAAFYDCDALTEITLPATVLSVGDLAFHSCDNLEKVVFESLEVEEAEPAAPTEEEEDETTKKEPVGTKIGAYAFLDCKALSEIVLPNNLLSVGTAAFSECDSLTEIALPESTTTLGDMVFYGCDKLASLTVPASVVNIGADVITNCPVIVVDTPTDSAFAKDMAKYNYTFTEPEGGEPEGGEPEGGEPEGNEPEGGEPEGNEPEGGEPEGNA